MQIVKFLPLAFVPFLAFAACSNNNNGGDDGGTTPDGNSGGDAPANGVHQTGTVADFSAKTPVAGATVTGGGSTATTDAKGTYTLTVAKDTPYTMTVSDDGYLTLHEQEWQLSADADRGQTLAVGNTIENILKNALSPLPDPTLGVLSVDVVATGSCTSPVGASITVPGQAVDGGTGVQVVYFSGGFPASGATTVQDTGTPSAVIYDLPVGKFSQITVTHPSCTAVAFPVADPNIPTLTYTGNVEVDPSGPTDDAGVQQNVASFIRVFIK